MEHFIPCLNLNSTQFLFTFGIKKFELKNPIIIFQNDVRSCHAGKFVTVNVDVT